MKEEKRVVEQNEAVESDRFHIADEKQATWAFRKIAEAEKRINEIEEVRETEVDRIERWAENEKRGELDTVEYMQSLLAEYLFKRREKDPKFKVSTPYGRLSTRKRQPSIEFDKDKVIDYFEKSGKNELITVKKDVKMNDLKSAITLVEKDDKLIAIDENGEVLDFITALEKPDSLIWKVEP